MFLCVKYYFYETSAANGQSDYTQRVKATNFYKDKLTV